MFGYRCMNPATNLIRLCEPNCADIPNCTAAAANEPAVAAAMNTSMERRRSSIRAIVEWRQPQVSHNSVGYLRKNQARLLSTFAEAVNRLTCSAKRLIIERIGDAQVARQTKRTTLNDGHVGFLK